MTDLSADRDSGPKSRDYRGAALLREGFRPFFLAAGLWAALAMPLWMAVWLGWLTLPTAFDPVTWHGHQMLFGFVGAAIAGFLLTAVPNWTGRLPVRGWPLGLLAGIWLVGRLAVAFSEIIGVWTAAFLDLAFFLALFAVLLREIAAGRNWRNLPVVLIVCLLLVCNLLVHLEFVGAAETAAMGLRLSIAVVGTLIALIGGRIVPSFTRNWLKKRGETVMPAPFGRFDKLVIAVTLSAGVAWAVAPDWPGSGGLCLLAGLGNAWRLSRWRGHRTGAEPLVWVLHLGYSWIPLGFVLLGLAVLLPDLPRSAALHALTSGAMGTMILAVMTRAILGHTGQALTAGGGTTAIYGLVTLATLLRTLVSVFDPANATGLLAAALCWFLAFGLFLVLYTPLLTRRRKPA